MVSAVMVISSEEIRAFPDKTVLRLPSRISIEVESPEKVKEEDDSEEEEPVDEPEDDDPDDPVPSASSSSV